MSWTFGMYTCSLWETEGFELAIFQLNTMNQLFGLNGLNTSKDLITTICKQMIFKPVFYRTHVALAKAKPDRQTDKVIPMWRFASLFFQVCAIQELKKAYSEDE